MMNRKFRRELDKTKMLCEFYKQKFDLLEEYKQYIPKKKEKKGKKVSNIMLVSIVIAILGYTIASFILQYHTAVEMSPTLTTCWFSFWGVELVALAGIKISKVKHGSDDTVG
jgi:uncharacterized membrane protein